MTLDDLRAFRDELDAMRPELEAHWGDPNVMHRAARRLEEIARSIAQLGSGSEAAVTECLSLAAHYRQITPPPLQLTP